MGKGKPSKKMSKKAMGPAGFNAATKASGGRHANMSQHAVSKKQKKKAQKGQRRLMAAAAAAGGSKSKDMDASRAGPYSPQQATLLIGEGDFSFAAAIAMIWRDAQNLVATAFDDEESAARKYATLAENVETVRQCGGTVLFGVDATKCHTHKVLKRMAGGFDRVVFNFPHLGTGMKDMGRNVKQHQDLLRGFFMSASSLLSPPPKGELHVTMKRGEPYDSWQLVTLAKMCGFRVKHCTPFMQATFPGYAHRRTIGDLHAGDAAAHEPNAEISGARTYVFATGEMPVAPPPKARNARE